jgi:hypothetical protein
MSNKKHLRTCNCIETYSNTETVFDANGNEVPARLEPSPHHDCTHIRERNSYIPDAEAFANARFDQKTDGYKWTRCFSTKMDELCAGI